MPGAVEKGDKLLTLAASVDQQMGGHPQSLKIGKAGVGGAIQGVAKQSLDMGPAKGARGQTDVVDHQQIDIAARGALVKIGGWTVTGLPQPATLINMIHSGAIVTRNRRRGKRCRWATLRWDLRGIGRDRRRSGERLVFHLAQVADH